jgi:CRP-like cAMP-binding protein
MQLKFKQVLYEDGSSIDYVYFPVQCVLSALLIMDDGHAIEVATVGSEGVAGLPAFLQADTSLTRVIVQVAGGALRMKADALAAEATKLGPVRQLLLCYQNAFLGQVMQGVACNGLHTIQQRCCRWLLETDDRVQTATVPLTHEFLALMLGVRRASVSEVLGPLQAKGAIKSERGKIVVLDRGRA